MSQEPCYVIKLSEPETSVGGWTMWTGELINSRGRLVARVMAHGIGMVWAMLAVAIPVLEEEGE